jgi:ribonuclease MRP protein subunit RMP1
MYMQNLTDDRNRAFSTVIAENQFSTLGIVLLATLSRFTKATGTKFEEETRQRPQAKKKTQPTPATEDRGERVSRADIDVGPSLEQEPRVHKKKSEQSTDAKSSTVKKSKKAKRKKNAIDDLFSGLF